MSDFNILRTVRRASHFTSSGWLRALVPATVVAATSCLGAGEAQAFGLEAWGGGTRWHGDICKAAMTSAKVGFSAHAAHQVCWNNDAFDMYLNHPLWDIYSFAKSGGNWEAGHFDNVFNADGITSQWARYYYGAYYGLRWAAERNDVVSAFAILGLTAHAFEDFFSHSTWVNDASRRAKTPFQFTEAVLRALPNDGANPASVWTGAYERDTPAGKNPHGGGGFGNKLKAVASSPTCSTDNGINLDRSCSAELGFKNRHLSDRAALTQSGGFRTLFTAARTAAGESDKELFSRLGQALRASGQGAFWDKLKAYSHGKALQTMGSRWSDCAWEKNATGRQAPWGFLTAGSYPGAKGWYLRIEAQTSDGTDGDIHVKTTNSGWQLLDRPDYNDFEKGDKDAYYIGPVSDFRDLSVRLTNKGMFPAWKAHVTVWAYHVGGGKARYGRVVDSDVSLDNSTRTFPITLPASGTTLSPFAP